MPRALNLCVVVLFCGIAMPLFGQSPAAQPLTEAQREKFERDAKALQTALDTREKFPRPIKAPAESLKRRFEVPPASWADVAIFAKGVSWALKYDREFTSADIGLMEKGIHRAGGRLPGFDDGTHPWAARRGKLALGYVSMIDGSAQPYGLIVPKGYDPKTPIRLDVVLHGSTRPVGMSELRFIARFDEGDAENPSPPDQPFIELHPLGRVENCYRWAGETDVFEAIEDVCRRYNIDRHRIVLRGMSMGASGTWHLGLKHPDRFVAIGPYCGYVDTHKFSETPLPNFVKVGPLPEHQELGLHMLDSIDYAANAGVVPAIACMGEKDVFFQAHVIMGEAMQREGLTMTNLISPGTGHVIDPVTHAEQMRRIAEHVTAAPRQPRELRFVTWTLKYNRCHWIELLGLDQHYARAEISAKLVDGMLVIDEPRNINRFAVLTSQLPSIPKAVRVGTSEFPFPQNVKPDLDDEFAPRPVLRLVFVRSGARWQIPAELVTTSALRGKRPGVQGPIDDAFTSPFVCVRGTGQPWNATAQAYADASLRRFASEWHHYFRGELPIIDDTELTTLLARDRNLILFGDPGSNSWIAKLLPTLPLKWSQTSLTLGDHEYSAADHIPALIAPLGQSDHYVVINSGHTFREAELAKLNYLLFPRWGDWAVLQIPVDQKPSEPLTENVIHAGYFDEQWQFKK